MTALLKDLGFALRLFRRNPAFSLTVAATLALGIGASTAIFSVVNAVLIRPLPYKDPQKLMLVWGDMRNRKVFDFPFPDGDFNDLRERGTLFESIAAVRTGRGVVVGGSGEPEQIRTALATANIFNVLGARFARGQGFNEADGTPAPPPPAQPPPQPGAPPQAQPQPPPPPPLPRIVVLSHEFWTRRFGADPDIVGKNIELGGGINTVAGVLAPGFELLFPPDSGVERVPDVWTAARVNFAADRQRLNVSWRVVGRLKPDATQAQAQAQVDQLAADLRKQFPIKETAGLYFRLEPMGADLVQDVKPALLALLGAVGFVLLIACANVANLLLARASSRERELAVRAALGGSRLRLIRQMLAESLVLATAGAAIGLGLAYLGIKLLMAVKPDNLPRIDHVAIDPLVLGFTAFATVLAAVTFGLLPALRASRTDVIEVLKRAGRSAGLGATSWLRNGVVVAEVALCFVLLVGSGLMLRSFMALQQVDPGFDPKNVLTFTVSNLRFNSGEQVQAFLRDFPAQLRAIPSVEAVTAAAPLPLDGLTLNCRWGTEAAVTDASAFQQANVHWVLPGYFEAMRAQLLQGRFFTDADNTQQSTGIVIDDLVARKAFPGQPAVGKRLYVRLRSNEPEWLDVIGVVRHQRHATLTEEGREAIFFADGFGGGFRVNRWAVRSAGDPAALTPALRAQIAKFDPRIVVSEVRPMLDFVRRAQAQTRFALILIAVFGGIAAVLAAVGLYGVLSTVVRQRTAEIGVRMAFGAGRGSVFGLVVGHGLKLSMIGIVLGLAAAVGLTRVMSSMLVEVKPNDPATFGAIAALFFVVATIACTLPALRASRLSPTVALRDE